MLILITGGSSCGKSAFAEQLAVKMRDKFGDQASCKMVYIATMEPFSEDASIKIKHHHDLRAGKGFVTLEHYTDIEKAIPKLEIFSDKEEILVLEDPAAGGEPVSCPEDFAAGGKATSGLANPADRKKPVVLLECLSNLLANEMFAPKITEEMRRKPDFENCMCQRICTGIRKLETAAACLIVVSCNVGEDGASYAWETVKYIHILQKIQAELAKGAAQVLEVVCGIPIVLKDVDGQIQTCSEQPCPSSGETVWKNDKIKR